MGRSSELYIKMQQQQPKDVPEYLTKETKNVNNTRNTPDIPKPQG